MMTINSVGRGNNSPHWKELDCHFLWQNGINRIEKFGLALHESDTVPFY